MKEASLRHTRRVLALTTWRTRTTRQGHARQSLS